MVFVLLRAFANESHLECKFCMDVFKLEISEVLSNCFWHELQIIKDVNKLKKMLLNNFISKGLKPKVIFHSRITYNILLTRYYFY